jgi:hypothetical protein
MTTGTGHVREPPGFPQRLQGRGREVHGDEDGELDAIIEAPYFNL